ncbi:hypothetical protein [Erwinia oleae]|uniref:hypothetical protein n=1 Tax=Erwinia oleae TaxID=796334 RepID=UPI0005516914|nr:hypothetical protein [Erwinia oleae]
MPKSQMRLANRAWRTNTRALGWMRGWKGGKRAWKAFCRENAEVTVQAANDDMEPILSQEDADERVSVELSYWD